MTTTPEKLDKETKDVIDNVRYGIFFSKYALLFLVPLVFVCSYFFYRGIIGLKNDLATEDWPAIQGIVSHIKYHDDRDDERRWTDVKYKYKVNEKEYEGYRISVNSDSSSYESAYTFAKQHPKGTPVKVYYNTEQPSDAVLEPGPDLESYLLPALMGFLCFLCFLIIYIYIKLNRIYRLVRTEDIRGIQILVDRNYVKESISGRALLLAAELKDDTIFNLLAPKSDATTYKNLTIYAQHRASQMVYDRFENCPEKPKPSENNEKFQKFFNKLISHLPLFCTAMLLFILGYCLFYDIKQRRDFVKSAHWRQTSGQVIKSSILRNQADLTDNDPYVAYNYEINGKKFTGEKIYQPGGMGGNLRNDFEIAEFEYRFAREKTIPVYYNPKKPSSSYLVKSGAHSFSLTIIMLVFTIIILSFLWKFHTILKRTRIAKDATETADVKKEIDYIKNKLNIPLWLLHLIAFAFIVGGQLAILATWVPSLNKEFILLFGLGAILAVLLLLITLFKVIFGPKRLFYLSIFILALIFNIGGVVGGIIYTAREFTKTSAAAIKQGMKIVPLIQEYEKEHGRLPDNLGQLDKLNSAEARNFGYFRQKANSKKFAGNPWVLFKTLDDLFLRTAVFYPKQNYPDTEAWYKIKNWALVDTGND